MLLRIYFSLLSQKKKDEALHTAAGWHHPSEIRDLIKAGASKDGMGPRGESALICAASEGRLENVRTLLDYKASPDFRDKYGNTALMMASLLGFKQVPGAGIRGEKTTEIVDLLLDAKASLDIQNEAGYTALMFAAREGQDHVVQKLVEAGARLDLRNHDGKTALMLAAEDSFAGATADILRRAAGPAPLDLPPIRKPGGPQ